MITPYLFQLQDVRRIERWHGRSLIAFEMGLGKTVTALHYALRNPTARPIIVVCQASIKWQWQREAARHARLRGEVLSGNRPSKAGFANVPQLFVVNYDILHSWIKFLRNLRPQLIIVDECQMIRSRGTRRTRAVRALCRGVPHVLALGGTGGMENRPSELWPTLNILRPDRFPTFLEYAFAWCKPQRKPWGWEFKGSSDPVGLHKLLSATCMVRRRKADVLKQLPSKQRSVVLLDIIKRREYEQALNDFRGWLKENHGAEKARVADKAERLTQLGYLKRLAAKLKLGSVMEWIDNFLAGSNEKLILFAYHKAIVRALNERYERESVTVTGETIGKKRQLAFDQFLHNQRTRLLIGNIKAAGTGWSAPGVSTVAFAELDWTPGAMVQAEDRIHGIQRGRKGQRSEVYFLVARGTLEEDLCAILQRKAQVLSKTLDGKVVKEDLDIYDLLCAKIMKGG